MPHSSPLPFEIVRELGRGAAGLVYEVRVPNDPRRLVAKVLAAPTDQARKRFQREGEVVARLRHPHLVSVHGGGTLPDGRPYLLLDFVAGETLQDQLSPVERFDPDRAVEVTRQLASALAHAHAQGVTHRDVKPANVLIDDAGQVRLTDFGVAHTLDEQRLTQTGGVVGTPAYMAPEQLTAPERVGPWTDVYACGVLLYELLTGELPPGRAFTRSSSAANPRDLSPEISPALGALVRRCLATDPAKRPPDGAALLGALDGLGEGREPRWPVLAAALVVLLLIGAAFGAARSATAPAEDRPSPAPAPGSSTRAPPLASTAQAESEPALQLRLQLGLRFRCRLQVEEQRGILSNRLTWWATHHVRESGGKGHFWIEATIERGKLEQTTSGKLRVVYDSRGGDYLPEFRVLGELVGSTFGYLQEAATGKVRGFRGGNKMADRLKRRGFPGAYWLEDKQLIYMFNGLWGVLPGRAVRRRESWRARHLELLYRLTQRNLRTTVVAIRDGRVELRTGARPAALPPADRHAWGAAEWSEGRVARSSMSHHAMGTVTTWKLQTLD